MPDTTTTTSSLGKVTLKLAVVWGVMFSLQALCTCIIASLSNVKWNQLEAQSKFLIVLMIFGNWSTTMMAFLSKTVARLEAGKEPIPMNGTDVFTKGPDGTVTTVTTGKG